MKRVSSPDGVIVSYDESGSGPALVLVHGAFSDHVTNWEFVQPLLQDSFTLCAIARRGRGQTDATDGHTIEDEARDVVAVIESLTEPVFLLGHSYGAHCALAAALLAPDRIRKLVVYEPPRPDAFSREALARLETLAASDAWEEFTTTFFLDLVRVPVHELDALRATALWPPIVADGRASLGDLRSLARYHFDPERWRRTAFPVLLQTGSESPRDIYLTDALAVVLPDARVEELPGQAHEAMTTAPEMYATSITRFLLG